jgi:hypothetical protein
LYLVDTESVLALRNGSDHVPLTCGTRETFPQLDKDWGGVRQYFNVSKIVDV